MLFFLRFLTVFFSFFVLAPSFAAAEVFYIEDQGSRFSVSFPDKWRVLSAQEADDRLVLAAPGRGDYASCRVRVRDDRRAVIYPHRFQDEAQRLSYGAAFWPSYFGDYDNVSVRLVNEHAGLGRGPASYAEAYYSVPGHDELRKRSLAFVSLYHDKAYIVECSSLARVFDKWRNPFLSVIKSVDFKKILHELPTGHYRNFLKDGTLRISGEKEIYDSYY